MFGHPSSPDVQINVVKGCVSHVFNHATFDKLLYFYRICCKICTELAKKVCPRLRDSACWRSGETTQPMTHFFGQLCNISNSSGYIRPPGLGSQPYVHNLK